jgi:hypothetical protein
VGCSGNVSGWAARSLLSEQARSRLLSGCAGRGWEEASGGTVLRGRSLLPQHLQTAGAPLPHRPSPDRAPEAGVQGGHTWSFPFSRKERCFRPRASGVPGGLTWSFPFSRKERCFRPRASGVQGGLTWSFPFSRKERCFRSRALISGRKASSASAWAAGQVGRQAQRRWMGGRRGAAGRVAAQPCRAEPRRCPQESPAPPGARAHPRSPASASARPSAAAARRAGSATPAAPPFGLGLRWSWASRALG